MIDVLPARAKAVLPRSLEERYSESEVFTGQTVPPQKLDGRKVRGLGAFAVKMGFCFSSGEILGGYR